MAIRREIVLCLAALGIGGYLAWSALGKSVSIRRPSRTEKAYAPQPVPPVPVADVVANVTHAPGARDLWLEPNESKPLAPRDLPFPKLGAAPAVAVPLDPGPHGAAWYLLRIPGQSLAEPFQLLAPPAGGEGGEPAGKGEPAAKGAAPNAVEGAVAKAGGAGAPPAGAQGKQERIAKYEQTYDRVEVQDSEPWWGEILNKDKFDLDGKKTFAQSVLLRAVSPESGKTTNPSMEFKPEKVTLVVLSKSLRTQIELTKHRLPKDVGSLPQRAAFLEDLLRAARKETWVYSVAAEQADLYAKLLTAGDEGQRWRARVAAEQGDPEAEWNIYDKLSGEHADSGFKWAGIGKIQAQLGLAADAEESLRKAVKKAPADPRVLDALARFLIEQGRPEEALPHADAALRTKGMVNDPALVFGFQATMLKAQLALGRTDQAKEAASKLDPPQELTGTRDLYKGCLEYAAGSREAALTALRAASDGTMAATLAQAACMLAVPDPAGVKWLECKALLESVRDGDPLLRHRADAALALLFERSGHLPEALAAAEAAYAVNPRDPYVLYVLGRERRLSGQPDQAAEPLARLLRQNDAVAEACVELALAEEASALTQGGDQMDLHFARAVKLMDRAVELDQARGPSTFFLELQGRIAFEANDPRLARAAFEKGADKSLFCKIGLAIVEYSQNNVEGARAQLVTLSDKLKSGDPMRDYVTGLLKSIDDWSGREQIRETFDRPDLQKGERADLSKKWEVLRGGGGSSGPMLQDNALRIVCESSGKPISAGRRLDRAKNFLRVEVKVTSTGEQRDRFAGLVLVDEGRGTGPQAVHDFEAWFGVRDGKPYLRIADGDKGSSNKAELFDPVTLPDSCRFEPGKPFRVCFEAVPKTEGDTNAIVLRCLWDDAVVHERDIQRINRNSSNPLLTNLQVEAPQRQALDVAFDDYRLVRRREK